MRQISILAFVVFLCITAKAQTDSTSAVAVNQSESDSKTVSLPIDPSTGEVNYTEVVKADSLSADQLYGNAKFFVANAFKSAKDVTQLQDDNAKSVVCKGNFTGYRGNGFIDFTLSIQCKDGRYKYSISNLVHRTIYRNQYAGGNLANEKPDCGTFYMPKKYWNNLKSYADATVQALIFDLKKKMSDKISSDW